MDKKISLNEKMYIQTGHLSSVKHWSSTVDDSIMKALEIAFEFVFSMNSNIHELITLGAVYVNNTRAQNTHIVKKGDYIRIHTCPKRFDIQNIHWKKRILFQNKSFLVFDKPQGVPIHATVDNKIENTLSCLEECLQTKLYITHRLDQDTEGLVVVAKTPEFQKTFNQLISQRKVEKIYHAVVNFPGPPLGFYTHYMAASKRSPKTILPSLINKNDQICELQILAADELVRSTDVLPNEKTQKLTIHLITGRTHQIRAQLAYLGSPILGDKIYNHNSTSEIPLQLVSQKISFMDPETQKHSQFVRA